MCTDEDSPPTGVRFRSITGARKPSAGLEEISSDDEVDETRQCGGVGMRLLRPHPRCSQGRLLPWCSRAITDDTGLAVDTRWSAVNLFTTSPFNMATT
jgi:hypothetical protein